MGILQHVKVTVSGLAIAGLAALAPLAAVAAPAYAEPTTTTVRHQTELNAQADCYWKCDRWRHGKCRDGHWVCPRGDDGGGGGGGGGGGNGGGGGGGGGGNGGGGGGGGGGNGGGGGGGGG